MRINIVFPAYNEAPILEKHVTLLSDFVAAHFVGDQAVIIIADNGSDDGTSELGRTLATRLPNVAHLHIDGRGKGLAIRTAWHSHEADVYAFMDADLAVDLAALPQLVTAAMNGAAIGSRYHPQSVIRRTFFRQTLSLAYRIWIKALFGTKIRDATCGFKAFSAALIMQVMPAVRDNTWFFDSELLLRAERAGFAITELPVSLDDWTAPTRKSKIRPFAVSMDYIRKTIRLKRDLS